MKKKINYSCIQSLKETGAPVIIVTLPEEVEANDKCLPRQ